MIIDTRAELHALRHSLERNASDPLAALDRILAGQALESSLHAVDRHDLQETLAHLGDAASAEATHTLRSRLAAHLRDDTLLDPARAEALTRLIERQLAREAAWLDGESAIRAVLERQTATD